MDWGDSWAGKAESRQGGPGMSGMQLRQTESPHTPESSEINASNFSAAKGKIRRRGSNKQTRPTVGDWFFFTRSTGTQSVSWTRTDLRSAALFAHPAGLSAHRWTMWIGTWEDKQAGPAENHHRSIINLIYLSIYLSRITKHVSFTKLDRRVNAGDLINVSTVRAALKNRFLITNFQNVL